MSKVIKKITKPVSRVLDKIVPNEIKPLLPYAAAFMPYLLPAGGIFSGMVGRGLASAGANAVGQLAQEGNEGELNALSLLLAGAQGAGTAQGAGSKLRGFKNPGEIGYDEIARGNMPGMSGGFKTTYDTSNLGFLDKSKNFGLEGLANLSDKLGGARDTLQGVLDMDPTKANLEKITAAGATPFSQATGDVAYGDAIRQKKEFDRNEAREAVEAEMRQRGLDQEYIDAITSSMTAYGYTQADIDAILELRGYATGGRVGLREGGLSMMGQMDLFGGAGSRPNLGAQLKPIMQGGIGGGNNLPIFPRLDELRTGVSQAETSLEDINNRLGSSNNGTFSSLQQATPALRLPAVIDPGRNPFNRGPGYAFGGGIMSAKSDPDFMAMTEIVENVDGDKIQDSFEGATAGGYKLNDFAIDEQLFNMSGKKMYYLKDGSDDGQTYDEFEVREMLYGNQYASGGVINNYNMGGSVLPQGMEMDYREGGMIPMGSKEKADDVPARVSKNEFVMTADAVRAAGGGSVNKGAQRMYQLMNNLEARS